MAIGPLAATQNKMLSLSHKQHCHGSQIDVSYCVNGFHADSCHNEALFVLLVVVALFMVSVFTYFFQKFPNFSGQVCGLGLISVTFMFTKFLPSVVQPTAHLSWISVMLQAMDEYVFTNEGPLVDLYPLPVCFVFNQCRIRIRMDIGY